MPGAERMPARPTVAMAIGAFWPGNDASGPNQSFRALRESLGAEFRFTLFARDRPFGAQASSPGKGLSDAHYLVPARPGPRGLLARLRATRPDALWLNGFFDRDFTLPLLLAHRAGLLGRTRLLLSPRGEFHPGALALKPRRKRWGRALLAPFLREVTLHAADGEELAHLRCALPRHKRFSIAANPRALPPMPVHTPQDGPLRIVFLGRIARNKGLHRALAALTKVRAPVLFTVIGPAEDESYLRECLALAAGLPPHVTLRWRGALPQSDVPQALAQADLLFLPTAGESFGHAVFEALSAGTPVLLSDKTPWRGLERAHAGWDLSLATDEPFAQMIDRFARLDAPARSVWRTGARALAEAHVVRSRAAFDTAAMLRTLLEPRS